MTTIRASEPVVARVRGGGLPRRRAANDRRPNHTGPSASATRSVVDDRIAQLLAEAPPLSPEQIGRLRLLLSPCVPASRSRPSVIRAARGPAH